MKKFTFYLQVGNFGLRDGKITIRKITILGASIDSIKKILVQRKLMITFQYVVQKDNPNISVEKNLVEMSQISVLKLRALTAYKGRFSKLIDSQRQLTESSQGVKKFCKMKIRYFQNIFRLRKITPRHYQQKNQNIFTQCCHQNISKK